MRGFAGCAIAAAAVLGLLPAGSARAAGGLTIGCSPSSCTVNAGQSITLTAYDTANNNQATYPGKTNWDFDGSNTYGQANGNPVQQAFKTPGKYPVDASYGSETGSVVVTVNQQPAPPTADFTCTPGCTADAGATISFQPSTDAAKPTYSWDLNGDGTTDSTDAAPSYTYSSAGTYNVTLQVTDSSTGQSSSTASHTVTIYAPPTVTTGSASAPTTTSATLNGTVNPNGAQISDCHFDYGLTTSYGSTIQCAQAAGSGTGPVPVNAGLSGLTPGTTYHYRLVASHGFGNVNGADVTFATAGNAAGFAATLALAGAGNVHAGDAAQLNAGATTPAGYHVYSYRWAFNGGNHFTTQTGSIGTAIHHYAHAGSHTAEVEVMATDGVGHAIQTTASLSFSTASSAAGCNSDQVIGFLEFVASCITEHSGRYEMSLDGGVNLDGIELTSTHSGAKLIFDTTGASEHGDNPHHMWALRSEGPVAISIANTPLGSIQLTTLDLEHSPVFLPIGADVPDQHAPGLRIFTFTAGHSCTPQPTAFPPVVCARLPGGFPLEGSISLFVTGNLHDPAPGLSLQANVHVLPPVDISAELGLTGNVTDGVHLDSFGFATPTFHIGSIITVDPVTFNYIRLDDEEGHVGDMDVYKASGGVHFNIASHAAGLSVAVRFANGGFQEANVNLTGTFPMGPVVLNQLGATIGVHPLKVGGNIAGIIGPLGLSAGVLYTEAYGGQPMHIQIGSSDPEHDPNHVAALYVQYPSVNPVLKIGGTLNLYGDGFVSGGITVDFALPNVDSDSKNVEVAGYVRGWFSPAGVGGSPQPQYQISGGVRADVHVLINLHGEVQGYVNNYWAGGANHSDASGCGDLTADLGPFHPSVGGWVHVDLAHGNHVDDGIDGGNSCNDISGWCAPASASSGHDVPPCLGFEDPDRARLRQARAAASTVAQRFWVPAGISAENLRINSLAGIPRVTISGPSGTFTTSADGSSTADWPHYLSGGDLTEHQLSLGLLHPKPGVYTVTPVAGSPAIEPLLEAHPLPDPQIRATVLHNGSRWQLRFSQRTQRGQQVQFLERSGDVDAPIGKPTAAASGTIAFTPTTARSTKRTIVAIVLEQGMPQRPRTVGSYRAPGVAKLTAPRKISFSRAHNRIVVTWPAVTGAAAYEVTVAGSDGRRAIYRTARPRLTLDAIFPEVSLKVSVAAVGTYEGRLGTARTITLPRLPAKR